MLDDFTPEIMLGRDGLERFLNLDLDVAEELIGHSSPMFHGRQLSPPLGSPSTGPRLSSPLLAAAGLHARRRSFAQQLEEEEEAALLDDEARHQSKRCLPDAHGDEESKQHG